MSGLRSGSRREMGAVTGLNPSLSTPGSDTFGLVTLAGFCHRGACGALLGRGRSPLSLLG